jgi:hypothetical protein
MSIDPPEADRIKEFFLFYLLKRAERHAAQAPALRERNHTSTFCGSIFDILQFAVQT